MERKYKGVFGGSILAISCLFPAVLPAAEPELYDPGMDDESMLFMDIPSVYSASKYEQSVTEAPTWVSIVTADEIRKYGYRTFDDILGSVPGFYTSNDRNYNYLGVRGFSRPGDYNTRVLLMLDGVRTNDGLSDAAAIGRELLVDVDLIDRVEISRGPGSSLYGANAFFAVINIITKRGRDLQAPEVAASYGSHDSKEGRFSYGERLDNGVEVLLSGTKFDSDGDDRLYYPEFDDPATNNGVAEDGDGENSGNLFATLSFEDFTLQGAYTTREKHFPTASYGTEFNDPRNHTNDKTYLLALKYDHAFRNQVEFHGNLSYQRYDYNGDYVYDYADPGDPPYLVVNKDDSEAKWWDAEGQFTVHSFERHKLVFGAEFRDKQRQNQYNYDEEPYLEDERDTYNWGVYAQDEFALLDNLNLFAGARYDYYKHFGGKINPRVGMVYTPVPATTVKLLYGSAFRVPNGYEQYYHDSYESTKPADDLDEEEIDTYELILEQFIGRHLRGVANLFYYKIDNLITLTTDPADDLLVFTNSSDSIKAKGLELALEGNWDSGWKGQLSYTLTDTDDDATGDGLSNSPKHLAKANVIAPLLGERLFAGMEVLYTGERDSVRGKTLDDFTVANLTLTAPKVWKGLDLSGSIYNVFDKEYSHAGSEEHEQDGIEQDGRTYRVKLIYRF
jgi:iron complex outermembrane receptor protein